MYLENLEQYDRIEGSKQEIVDRSIILLAFKIPIQKCPILF